MSARYIDWNLKDLYKRFSTDLPQLFHAASASESVTIFKQHLKEIYNQEVVKRLCDYDGQTIHDFSTEKDFQIQTVSILYSFLRDPSLNPASADLLTDLYFIFRNVVNASNSVNATNSANATPKVSFSEEKLAQHAKQWVSGLNPAVQLTREANKQRIIGKIIQRLERRAANQPYHLPEILNFKEKRLLVEEWWNDYRFHLYLAIKNPDDLNFYLDNTLSDETMRVLYEAKKKGIPFFITPYYLSLADITGQSFDDATLRSYILYSKELVDTFGEIKAWEREDKVESGKANAAGWILPEGNNIHRRYPDVAILIPDSRGRACGGLCASCQRMYDFQSKRLNFDLKELLPKESWPLKLKKLMTYFEEDTQLRDILITGGDALMSRNSTLQHIFEVICKMAQEKKTANKNRPDGVKYAEIQRIRLGTRLLAYLPMRIDDELIAILKSFREKALQIGIKQFFIQTHFQTPLEMTKEAKEAINRITSIGWIITNQLVFNVPASRRGHTASLRQTLIRNGVIPYYTFTVKGFRENYAVYAPIARLMQERDEEKIFGKLNPEQQNAFVEIIRNNIPYTHETNNFLKQNKRLFVATDRSVLNLPGIGKSMTFQLVGITPQGERILCFDHDPTRKHSPAIKQTGKIYITENKSIRSYLKQLEQLGEDLKSYQSIWEYTEGHIEPKFQLYEYPPFPFHPTDQVNHIANENRKKP